MSSRNEPFVLTREYAEDVAHEMGLAAEDITDEVLEQAARILKLGFYRWPLALKEGVKEAINFALKS